MYLPVSQQRYTCVINVYSLPALHSVNDDDDDGDDDEAGSNRSKVSHSAAYMIKKSTRREQTVTKAAVTRTPILTLTVTQNLTSSFLSYAVPRLWNALPISLRQSHISVGQFRRALKAHLFDCVNRA